MLQLTFKCFSLQEALEKSAHAVARVGLVSAQAYVGKVMRDEERSCATTEGM